MYASPALNDLIIGSDFTQPICEDNIHTELHEIREAPVTNLD